MLLLWWPHTRGISGRVSHSHTYAHHTHTPPSPHTNSCTPTPHIHTHTQVGSELPELADVLISEIVDHGLLSEGVIPTVKHAQVSIQTLSLPTLLFFFVLVFAIIQMLYFYPPTHSITQSLTRSLTNSNTQTHTCSGASAETSCQDDPQGSRRVLLRCRCQQSRRGACVHLLLCFFISFVHEKRIHAHFLLFAGAI